MLRKCSTDWDEMTGFDAQHIERMRRKLFDLCPHCGSARYRKSRLRCVHGHDHCFDCQGLATPNGSGLYVCYCMDGAIGQGKVGEDFFWVLPGQPDGIIGDGKWAHGRL